MGFGVRGLRCRALVSENEQVMQAVSGLSYWAARSGYTQHQLSGFIDDDAAVEEATGRVGRLLKNR